MADGTEKQIKDIRMGDRVKTVISDERTKNYKIVDDEIILRPHVEPNLKGIDRFHSNIDRNIQEKFFQWMDVIKNRPS